jgi:hypothetical protein
MKRLILMVASLAMVLVTGAVFAQPPEYRPDIGPSREHRLEHGARVQFSGRVRGIDMRAGALLLRKETGGVVSLKAPRGKLARLAPGDTIRVAVERSPEGIDHVVRMWRVVEQGEGNYRFDEM